MLLYVQQQSSTFLLWISRPRHLLAEYAVSCKPLNANFLVGHRRFSSRRSLALGGIHQYVQQHTDAVLLLSARQASNQIASSLYSRRDLAIDSSRNILIYSLQLGGIVLSQRDATRRVLEFLRRTFPCSGGGLDLLRLPFPPDSSQLGGANSRGFYLRGQGATSNYSRKSPDRMRRRTHRISEIYGSPWREARPHCFPVSLLREVCFSGSSRISRPPRSIPCKAPEFVQIRD